MDHRAHLPQTAINEALVMGLAAAIGLDVAPVRYAPELDAAVIARYDRQWAICNACTRTTCAKPWVLSLGGSTNPREGRRCPCVALQ